MFRLHRLLAIARSCRNLAAPHPETIPLFFVCPQIARGVRRKAPASNHACHASGGPGHIRNVVTSSSFDGLGLVEPLRLALKAEKLSQADADPGAGHSAPHRGQRPARHRRRPEPARRPPLRCPSCSVSRSSAAQRRAGAAARADPRADARARQPDRRALHAPTGAELPLRSAVIFGGVNQHHQVKALKAGVDILIATPGAPARPLQPAPYPARQGLDPRARRGRPHARHGLHP